MSFWCAEAIDLCACATVPKSSQHLRMVSGSGALGAYESALEVTAVLVARQGEVAPVLRRQAHLDAAADLQRGEDLEEAATDEHHSAIVLVFARSKAHDAGISRPEIVEPGGAV